MKLGLHIADFTWPGGAPRTVGHGMIAGGSDLSKIETLRTEVMPAIEAL